MKNFFITLIAFTSLIFSENIQAVHGLNNILEKSNEYLSQFDANQLNDILTNSRLEIDCDTIGHQHYVTNAIFLSFLFWGSDFDSLETNGNQEVQNNCFELLDLNYRIASEGCGLPCEEEVLECNYECGPYDPFNNESVCDWDVDDCCYDPAGPFTEDPICVSGYDDDFAMFNLESYFDPDFDFENSCYYPYLDDSFLSAFSQFCLQLYDNPLLDDCGVPGEYQYVCMDECGIINGNNECFHNIISVIDVPNDQGGFVHLNWTPSSLENQDLISSYYVYRYIPSEERGWEFLHEAPAQEFEEYGFTAPTNQVSVPTQDLIYETEYFVRAIKTDGDYFDSEHVYGYSIDNLSPSSPTMLTGEFENNSIVLTWSENSELDFRQYNIYRNGILLNSTLENFFIDNTFINGQQNQYNVSAVDLYYNESDLSLTVDIDTILFGDVIQDGDVNVLDIVALVDYILFGSNLNAEQLANGDFIQDGDVNVLDVVAIVDIILN